MKMNTEYRKHLKEVVYRHPSLRCFPPHKRANVTRFNGYLPQVWKYREDARKVRGKVQP